MTAKKKVKNVKFLAHDASSLDFYHDRDKEPGKGFSII